jgi:hypothetical protein
LQEQAMGREAIMDTAQNLNKTISWLTELDLLMNQIKITRDQNQLMARLQYVTSSKPNPELGRAWRNRIIVRSRLKKYTSIH